MAPPPDRSARRRERTVREAVASSPRQLLRARAVLIRGGDQHLVHPVGDAEHARAAVAVELGQDVIEEQYRRIAGAGGRERDLGETQRDSDAALLPAGSGDGGGMAADEQAEF